MAPTIEHVLCGTCLWELEQHCGLFEYVGNRTVITALYRLSARDPEFGNREFCCTCNKTCNPRAVIRMLSGSRLCKGNH